MPTTDLALIFQSLAANAVDTPLQQLVCGSMDIVDSEALIACLPELLHLKNLAFTEINDESLMAHTDRILLGLKRNGSLERVELTWTNNLPFFDEGDLLKVKNYGLRNQHIPSMVSNPRLTMDDGLDMTDRCLFPKLFGAAEQAPRTAPTVLLVGLMALRDAI